MIGSCMIVGTGSRDSAHGTVPNWWRTVDGGLAVGVCPEDTGQVKVSCSLFPIQFPMVETWQGPMDLVGACADTGHA